MMTKKICTHLNINILFLGLLLKRDKMKKQSYCIDMMWKCHITGLLTFSDAAGVWQ